MVTQVKRFAKIDELNKFLSENAQNITGTQALGNGKEVEFIVFYTTEKPKNKK